ncbi:hypothetical protein C0J52_04265 [Blattella germanica]|nr:hypothetical protein C0J52_04265 [Blattella germanica]
MNNDVKYDILPMRYHFNFNIVATECEELNVGSQFRVEIKLRRVKNSTVIKARGKGVGGKMRKE